MAQAQAALSGALGLSSSEARIEAQVLLMRAFGDVSRAWLIARQTDMVAPEHLAIFETFLNRRLAGEPVAYILGEREFYGLTFKVSPATLIPRPETELLVELALQRIPPPPPQPSDETPSHSTRLSKNDNQVAGYPAGGRGSQFRVLDLGTGSGAIALSIAHARPDADVVAVDASAAALEIAQFNTQQLGLGNVRLLHSDWFSALQGERFDIIVSNPPYIAAADTHLKQGDVRFEPCSALASGVDGLDDIRRICAQAKVHLNANGWLLFEHGYDQAARACALLQQSGFEGIFSARDLSGIERVSGGC
jgi:release factor glutamine methyltransferase